MTAPARPRATAMTVDDRRASVLAAVVPLVLEKGPTVTTRALAEAAGVAEGTLFRAFADKTDLLAAVVDAALDPAPAEDALAAIPLDLPLAERLERAVDVLRERVEVHVRIVAVAQAAGTAADLDRAPSPLPRLEALLAPDAARLRLPPDQTAHLLRGFTVASVHPVFHPGPARTSPEIVTLFLHGLLADPEGPSC